MFFVWKCEVSHFEMETRYLTSNSFKTMVLTSPILVRIQRSRDEVDCIHEGIIDKENESSDEDSDIVLSVRNRKVRVIDSESKSDSDAPQDPNKSEWTPFEESSEIPPRINFIANEKPGRQ